MPPPMKTQALILFLIASLATPAFATDWPRFATDKEAIDHYLKIIQDTKPSKSEQFFSIVGMNKDDKDYKDAIAKFASISGILDLAMDSAGAFRSAEVMKVLKYGSPVRYVGYMLLYEHNFIVIEMWFVNSTKGWQLVKFNFNVNSDPSDTIEKMPKDLGVPMEGY